MAVAGLIAFVLSFVLQWLYHKCVRVAYFGSMFRHLFKEWLACMIISSFVVSLFMLLLNSIGGVLLSILKFILKVAVVLIVAAAVIIGISLVVKAIKNKKGTTPSEEAKNQEGHVSECGF